tara:strand:+ start:207 stop:1208 length:1002 start_codon:yes stop_codon:yes gene_type:complete
MIICRTPYRISFFGGGTDYKEWYSHYSSEIISTTIDKYIYLSLRKLPNFFSKKNRIIYSKIEETENLKDIKLAPVKKILLFEKFKNGIEFHYDGQMPAKSGVGSSSSFVVGLTHICSEIKNKKLSKKSLAEKAINYERKLLGEVVGLQDQIATSYGGLNHIKIDKSGKFIVKPLLKNNLIKKKFNSNLVLLYSGIQKLSRTELSNYVRSINTKSKNLMLENITITKEAKTLLDRHKFSEFGILLDKSWEIKKKISKSISNTGIDNIYLKAKKSGALGGKLLGAGGGGFLLFYVPEERKKFFIKKMNFLTHIDFNFENTGSKIIYKNLKGEKYV